MLCQTDLRTTNQPTNQPKLESNDLQCCMNHKFSKDILSLEEHLKN